MRTNVRYHSSLSSYAIAARRNHLRRRDATIAARVLPPNRLTALLVRVCIRFNRMFSCLNCSACPCLVWPHLAPEPSCSSGLFEASELSELSGSSESFKLSEPFNCPACPCLASESFECLACPYLALGSSSFRIIPRIILCRVRISAKLCGFRQGRADSS